MKKKTIEEEYKVLDHIDHILLRPSTYLGSNKPHTSKKWILSDDKMVKEEITFIPSFLKIFDEILVNSIDESKRNPNLNKIEINIKDNAISVKDNGGIPVVIHKEHNKWVPEVIFGNLMSGSNYDDSDERIVSGTNGYGSKLTNVFSKKFTISTCDGKKVFTQTFSNNMREKTEPKVKGSKINFTEITYLPDYQKFGLKELDEQHFKLIQKRVFDVAGCNPNVKVYFNDQEIKIKSFEDYIKYYKDDFYYEVSKDSNWSIGIAPSDDGFTQISFVNSTETYDGGNHVDYILNMIISKIREHIQKKHKVDIKPSEVKNHISIFINSIIINPSFSSQTKEKLITEIKDFGSTYEVSEKLMKWVLKSEIVSSILDWINQKKLADENKLARNINKNLEKVKVEKLIDAKGKDRMKCTLGIFEGDSSIGAVRKYRDPNFYGAFPLKGKSLPNVSEMKISEVLKSETVINLMSAIGLKIGKDIDEKDLRYGRILILADADVDGNGISAMILNFLNKYWPSIFDKKMVYKVETPIVVVTNKKDKMKKLFFYKQSEYDMWYKKNNPQLWEIKYKKGLAALVDDEYDEIINNPNLTLIKKDDLSEKYLDIWFGRNSDLRKAEIFK